MRADIWVDEVIDCASSFVVRRPLGEKSLSFRDSLHGLSSSQKYHFWVGIFLVHMNLAGTFENRIAKFWKFGVKGQIFWKLKNREYGIQSTITPLFVGIKIWNLQQSITTIWFTKFIFYSGPTWRSRSFKLSSKYKNVKKMQNDGLSTPCVMWCS